MRNKTEMKPMLVIGLMSGTSVDGIDSALVKINPDLTLEFIDGLVFSFPENIKDAIYSMFQDKPAIKDICWLNFVLGEYFAQAALDVVKKAGLKPEDVDLIGSHGQTIYHFPTDEKINDFSKKSTLQIGESSIIAERTGITTVSDFRPRDIAADGEGAPLVCYADKLLFTGETPRAIQNIGGMANVTVISPECEVFAFDTGPGNVLIDFFTQKFFDKSYDKDGLIALSGQIDEKWLDYLMQNPYYTLHPPKTTGREYFSATYAEEILSNAPQNPNDIIATTTALTAKSISKSYKDFIFPKTQIKELVLGGGGAYNPALIGLLNKYFDNKITIKTHEDFGISNKFKEAIAFALLAYTSYYNIPNNIKTCTGAKKDVVLGKITRA